MSIVAAAVAVFVVPVKLLGIWPPSPSSVVLLSEFAVAMQ